MISILHTRIVHVTISEKLLQSINTTSVLEADIQNMLHRGTEEDFSNEFSLFSESVQGI